MYKTTIQIDGMACGMCESHVNDALRRALMLKKVSASHKKGLAEIISEQPPTEAELSAALAGSGYKVLAVQTESHAKKRLFGR